MSSSIGNHERALLSVLARTHPFYQKHTALWRRMGDIALNRITSIADKQRYLVQGDSEDKTHFEKRVELSTFLPETPGLVSEFIGAVFAKPARREFKKDGSALRRLSPPSVPQWPCIAWSEGRTYFGSGSRSLSLKPTSAGLHRWRCRSAVPSPIPGLQWETRR